MNPAINKNYKIEGQEGTFLCLDLSGEFIGTNHYFARKDEKAVTCVTMHPNNAIIEGNHVSARNNNSGLFNLFVFRRGTRHHKIILPKLEGVHQK